MGVKEGVDPKRLDEAGWGAIFADDSDPAIKDALSELLTLRREQAGRHFRLFEGSSEGHLVDESKTKFLYRHGAGPGPADPDKAPYYLMIVGDPERISNRFQSQLDVQYAVGRIHFETPDEYASYAASVVAAETGSTKQSRKITLFSVANSDDRATRLSSRHLMKPVFDDLKATLPNWDTTAYFGTDATKATLSQLFESDQKPAILFTASHGLAFPSGDPRQLAHQGALLCQDWPGPLSWQKPIPQEHYFAGDDLRPESDLSGMIAILRASYSAITPRLDEFTRQAFGNDRRIAPYSFVAKLPAKMLGHPNGGALAVLGLVERAWAYSSDWLGSGGEVAVYQSTIRRLLDGHPIGSASEYFNARYAELSTVLSDEFEEIDFGKVVNPGVITGMWTSNNDARNHAIIGDPAVRLAVE